MSVLFSEIYKNHIKKILNIYLFQIKFVCLHYVSNTQGNYILFAKLFTFLHHKCRKVNDMSELLAKSELNLNAAEYLLKNGHYATACHPAYYCCFQLMKFTIKEKLGIDYEQQNRDIANNKNMHTHNYVISKIKDEIRSKNKGDTKAVREFERDIKDLQESRIGSDYENISISRDICEKSISKAKSIIKTL